jgi:GT2 family glycosyltransferase
MLVGPHNTVVHVNQNLARDGAGYLSRAERPANFSSVTGACQMVKRSVFEHVDGYTEAFAVGFNDADFCCKVTEAGYLVVFSPYAELFHHEFASRGREEGDSAKMQRWQQERELMIAKWSSYFTSGDPFLNPNLDRNSCYFALPE